MTQNKELQKVKDRIRALLNMSIDRGASENEAEFAMAKVGELLAAYNINMSELDVDEENCIHGRFHTGMKKRSLFSVYMGSLARFCGVKVWVEKAKTEYVYVFFGFESDVQLAEYLSVVILTAMKNATADFKMTNEYRFADMHRKSLSTSFQNGMAYRLARRLDELAEQSMMHKVSNSHSLVVIAKDKKVDDELAKLKMRFRKLNVQTRTTSYTSAIAGHTAADKVNLSRPVTSENKTLLIGKG